MVKKTFLLLFLFFYILTINISFKIDNNSEEYINIEIRGEVEKEETISVPLGTKFSEILELIDLTDDADISCIPLNKVLGNNDVIIIPKINEINKISINSANIEELITLPGIGKTIASRIIEYRQITGSFRSIEELLNVKGIGKSKYEQIKDYISL